MNKHKYRKTQRWKHRKTERRKDRKKEGQKVLYAMKTAGVNLGTLPLQCETRSLIQALNMDTSAQ